MKNLLKDFVTSRPVKLIAAGTSMAGAVRLTTGITNKFLLGSAFVIGMGMVEVENATEIQTRDESSDKDGCA